MNVNVKVKDEFDVYGKMIKVTFKELKQKMRRRDKDEDDDKIWRQNMKVKNMTVKKTKDGGICKHEGNGNTLT